MNADNSKGQKIFSGGFFNDLMIKIRLTIKLVQDSRIDMLVKAIPILCLIYLVVPVDLLIGPFDDAVVLYFGMDFFISLCPRDIVDEYLLEIRGNAEPQKPEDIIDADFKEKE